MRRAILRSGLLPLLIASGGCAAASAPGPAGSPAPPPESILIHRATDVAAQDAPIYVVDGVVRPAEFLRTLDRDDIVDMEITAPKNEFATDSLPRRPRVVRITTRHGAVQQADTADASGPAPAPQPSTRSPV